MRRMKKILGGIDALNYFMGKIFCWTIMVMMILILYDVFMRYLIKKPTIWAGELTEIMLLLIVCVGGGATLLQKAHVRVDILRNRFSKKADKILDLIFYPFILLICLVLMIEGGRIALDAFVLGSRTDTMFAPKIWPIQSMIVLAGILLGLQTISEWLKALLFIMTKEDFESKWSG